MDNQQPNSISSWWCHIGIFHSYLTRTLENMVILGAFKPRARRVWVEGLASLADLGAAFNVINGTPAEAQIISDQLKSVADLIKDLRINSNTDSDLPDDVFRRWVGNLYDNNSQSSQ